MRKKIEKMKPQDLNKVREKINLIKRKGNERWIREKEEGRQENREDKEKKVYKEKKR